MDKRYKKKIPKKKGDTNGSNILYTQKFSSVIYSCARPKC